jgi:phospholipase/lecithinase/hemolysin
MKVWRLAAIAMLAQGLLAGTSQAGFSSVVAFGDSLSDTGNVFAVTGQPAAPYSQGRFSNGPVWVEDLATKLGDAPPAPSAKGGTDFAWGGAESGNGFSPQNTPNLLSQVGSFLALGKPLGPNDLVTVWAGGNDFIDGQTNPQVPVDNITTAITQLAGAGGKTFLVPGLPLLGEIPGTASLPQAQRDGLDALSTAFNADLTAKAGQLQSSLGVTVKVLDVSAIIQAVRANPGAYNFTNTTTGAVNDGVISGAGYLFWDNLHPTAPGHAILAGAAFNMLAPVPEPSTFALGGIAGVVLLGRAAVKRGNTARAA